MLILRRNITSIALEPKYRKSEIKQSKRSTHFQTKQIEIKPNYQIMIYVNQIDKKELDRGENLAFRRSTLF